MQNRWTPREFCDSVVLTWSKAPKPMELKPEESSVMICWVMTCDDCWSDSSYRSLIPRLGQAVYSVMFREMLGQWSDIKDFKAVMECRMVETLDVFVGKVMRPGRTWDAVNEFHGFGGIFMVFVHPFASFLDGYLVPKSAMKSVTGWTHATLRTERTERTERAPKLLEGFLAVMKWLSLLCWVPWHYPWWHVKLCGMAMRQISSWFCRSSVRNSKCWVSLQGVAEVRRSCSPRPAWIWWSQLRRGRGFWCWAKGRGSWAECGTLWHSPSFAFDFSSFVTFTFGPVPLWRFDPRRTCKHQKKKLNHMSETS